MSKVFTADEVKKHATRNSLWLVIRNDVYDVTAFVDEVRNQDISSIGAMLTDKISV